MCPSTLVETSRNTHAVHPAFLRLAATTSARTAEATVSATDFWAGFLTPFLDLILTLIFKTATAFQKHAETQVLALLCSRTSFQATYNFSCAKNPHEELTSATLTLFSATLNPGEVRTHIHSVAAFCAVVRAAAGPKRKARTLFWPRSTNRELDCLMQHHGLVQRSAPMSSTHKLQRQRSFWKNLHSTSCLVSKLAFQNDPRTEAENRHKNRRILLEKPTHLPCNQN